MLCYVWQLISDIRSLGVGDPDSLRRNGPQRASYRPLQQLYGTEDKALGDSCYTYRYYSIQPWKQLFIHRWPVCRLKHKLWHGSIVWSADCVASNAQLLLNTVLKRAVTVCSGLNAHICVLTDISAYFAVMCEGVCCYVLAFVYVFVGMYLCMCGVF